MIRGVSPALGAVLHGRHGPGAGGGEGVPVVGQAGQEARHRAVGARPAAAAAGMGADRNRWDRWTTGPRAGGGADGAFSVVTARAGGMLSGNLINEDIIASLVRVPCWAVGR